MYSSEKKVLAKLRQPIHYSYISKYILESDEEYTLRFLNGLVEDGYIKKHKYEGYYVAL